MGTKNNVNPNHYKEEGRERPGQDINQEINKQKFAQAQRADRKKSDQGGSEFIPGTGDAPAINESPTKDLDKDTGQATESANSSSNK
jgi:hypothetical protein